VVKQVWTAVVCYILFASIISGCCQKLEVRDAPVSGNPEIAEILRQAAVKHDLVGLGAGILDSSGRLELAVAGYRKAGIDDAIGIDDLWHLGSCGKSFTSTLMAKLVEAGHFDWNTPLGDIFLPTELDSSSQLSDVTIAQLLSHTAGLRREPHDGYNVSDTAPPTVQRLAAVRSASESSLEYEPGKDFQYSNLSYMIAGAVIEKLTGDDYEVAARKLLFEPMSMMSVRYEGEHPPGVGKALWQHTGRGCSVSEEDYFDNDPAVLRPAGCVRASMEDWSKFIQHHLVGEQGGTDYLSAESFEELHRSRGFEYALGWNVLEREWGGGRVILHQGSNLRNYSNVWIAPAKGFAVFVCSNQGDSFEATDEIAGELIQLHEKWRSRPDSD